MALSQSERDNLLLRLDERTNNIWRTVEELKEHNQNQNGYIRDALICSATNSRVLKIVSGIGGSGLALLFTRVFGLW